MINLKNILIIEDELIEAIHLKKMLKDIDKSFDISGPIDNVDSVIFHLKEKNDYDLIFSDIVLGDRLIFDAFKKVCPNCFVIYTSGFDDYAMNVIKNNGLDYLIKPIDPEELKYAIKKIELCDKNDYGLQTIYSKIDNNINKYQFRKVLLFERNDEIIPVKISDISFFYTKNSVVHAVLLDGNVYTMDYTLNDLEKDVLDPNVFFRINRQYIANIRGIKKIYHFFNSRLLIRLNCCKDTCVLSKDKVVKFKEWLSR